MTTHLLCLYERQLAPSRPLALPAATRVVYCCSGVAALGETTLAANAAALAPQALTVTARGPAPGTHLLWWELRAARGAAEDNGSEAKLSAELTLAADQFYLMRCDRVDFPPGGVALLHTHQGPGIRCLVEGAFTVETAGRRTPVSLFGAWFEAGPEPVYAEGARDRPSAFVRVMILPRHLLGQSSIHYVNEADRSRPKSQRYTVFVDAPIDA